MSSRGSVEHLSFSLELDNKEHIKRFFFLDGSVNKVLVEGFLGELKEISLIEGLMLEVRCSNGILRMDISEEELRRALAGKNEVKLVN